MELVALDMKRRGMYISRQLSFKSASYSQSIIDLTERQQRMYDEAAGFWSDLHGCFTTALEILKVKEKKSHPASRVMSQFWGCHQRFFRALCMAVKVPEVTRIAKQAIADGKCVVIGLQSTGEARLVAAVKDGEDLDDFAGLKQVAKTLVKQLPTGDYLNKYGVDDLDDDDSEEDGEDLLANARGRRAAKGKRGVRRGADGEARSEDDEDDEDMADFIAHDDEDDEEGSDSADEDKDDYEFEGDEPREKVKLPPVVKRLTMKMKRKVLAIASVSSANAMSEAHLNTLLKEVERKHRQGGCPSLMELAIKAGVIEAPQPAKKQKRADGAGPSSAPAGRAGGRLRRGAADKAASSYVEIDDSEADEEMDSAAEDDDDDDDVFQAPPSKNGLLHKTLMVRVSAREWKVGKVVEVKAKGQHRLQLDGGELSWFDLSNPSSWKWHAAKPAPGAAGRARKKVVSDDDDDDDDEDEGENDPPHNARAARGKAPAGRKPPARRAVAKDSDESASDVESSDEESDAYVNSDEDSEFEEQPKRKGKAKVAPPKAKRAAKPPPPPAAKKTAPKRKRSLSPDGDDDEADDSMDDSMDGLDDDSDDKPPPSAFQHDDAREIKQLIKLRRELLRQLDKLSFPDNPLDSLLHNLGGPENVAEMTGRKGRLVRDEDGTTVYAKRNEGLLDEHGRKVNQEGINLQERRNFMDGSKLVAIISEAASSGISLQVRLLSRLLPNASDCF